MNVKPLHTPEDHAWALRELDALWDKATPGTPDGERFEVLSTLIDTYEREHTPVLPPTPVEAIKFRMEQQGLSPRDLLPIFGTSARVSEVLTCKRGLSLAMIRQLNARLEIPLECLVQEYKLKKGTKESPKGKTSRSP